MGNIWEKCFIGKLKDILISADIVSTALQSIMISSEQKQNQPLYGSGTSSQQAFN